MRRRRTWAVRLVGAFVMVVTVAVSATQAGVVYWVDQAEQSLSRGNTDGSSVATLYTDLDTPQGVMVVDDMVYWTNRGSGDTTTPASIWRAAADGSGTPEQVLEFENAGFRQITHYAGKMYWTCRGTKTIYCADLDGNNVEPLAAGLNLPQGVAISEDRLYWTDAGNDKIYGADFSNLGPTFDLATHADVLADAPGGSQLVIADGKMYWSDFTDYAVKRSDLDGSNLEILVSRDDVNTLRPTGIAVWDGMVYWSDYDANDRISRRPMDGTGSVEHIIDGLTTPVGLWAGEGTVSNRVAYGESQLFLDENLVRQTSGVSLIWHEWQKAPQNPLIVRSSTERLIYLFGSVIREPDPTNAEGDGEPVFRMWYYAKGETERWVGYATSLDGIHWEKPDTGVMEIEGNSNALYSPNRLLEVGGVIRDPSPDVPTDERYKMVVADEDATLGRVYRILVSPDGLHWQEKAIFQPASPAKPDRCCLTWDPYEGNYLLYHRIYDNGQRKVGISTSDDFINWSETQLVMEAEPGDPPGTQIYSMMAFPSGGQWVGLPQIYHSLPDEQTIDIGIAHARDAVHWTRELGEIVLSNDVSSWDRFNQACATAPVRVGNELWLYYTGREYHHSVYTGEDAGDDVLETGIGLAKMRVDGFCSYFADSSGGEVTTVPLLLPEGKLYLNANSVGGEITVELLDESQNPIIPGGLLSEVIAADGVNLEVHRPGSYSLADFRDEPVCLRFHLQDADLYSWLVSLPGDLNGDGFVGGDDLDIVRSFWGQNVTAGDLLQGDPSNDGFVGGDDLDIVRANWGQGTPPAPASVPEPGAMILVFSGALMLIWSCRR